MTTEQHRAAEATFSSALARFDRIEGEVATYSDQLAEAIEAEQQTRERRDLEALTSATARRVALESLLTQAQDELEQTRERLREAEATVSRERAIIALLPRLETATNTEAELIAKVAELEAVIAPGLEEVFALYDRRLRELSAYRHATSAIDPSPQQGEISERGGQIMPLGFDQLTALQWQRSPVVWGMLQARLNKRRTEELREKQNQEALARIGRV